VERARRRHGCQQHEHETDEQGQRRPGEGGPWCRASVLLGLVWGVWHLPLMVANGEPPIPYLLLIVPHTVLMTWVVNSTRGSILLAMLFHAGLATALTTLDPGSQSLVEIALTWLVAAAVLVRYGPRDLARHHRVQLTDVEVETR
jgi:hypothetical protein